MPPKKPVIAIVGTTASGKTGLAVKLAHKFNGEIISADSRQVYRGLDIGSGKDLQEYSFEVDGKTIKIPYHLIDVEDPQNYFSLANFKEMAEKAIDDISAKNKLPIIAGGTGLYTQALIDNYQLSQAKPNKTIRQRLEQLDVNQLYQELLIKDKKFAEKISESEKSNKRRLIRYLEIATQENTFKPQVSGDSENNFLILGLTHPRELLRDRIRTRLKQRLEKEDLIGEVKRLNQQGLTWDRLKEFGLEYKYIANYLIGELSYEEMADKLNIAIGQFAKRQMTWLRRWERQGAKINWIQSQKEAEDLIEKFLKK